MCSRWRSGCLLPFPRIDIPRAKACGSALLLALQGGLADEIRCDRDQSHTQNDSDSDTSLGTAGESATA